MNSRCLRAPTRPDLLVILLFIGCIVVYGLKRISSRRAEKRAREREGGRQREIDRQREGSRKRWRQNLEKAGEAGAVFVGLVVGANGPLSKAAGARRTFRRGPKVGLILLQRLLSLIDNEEIRGRLGFLQMVPCIEREKSHLQMSLTYFLLFFLFFPPSDQACRGVIGVYAGCETFNGMNGGTWDRYIKHV